MEQRAQDGLSADAGARKERVALSSILASAGITIAKLVAGLMSGSLALLSEAGHALVDTAATILTYLAVKTANKPADAEHHYGHGKFESLAALAETVVLFILATVVVTQAIGRLRSGGGEFEPSPLAFGVLILSILVDFNRVRILRKVAQETGSQALAADAIHFASDMVGSVLVLVGLATALAGFKYGDALAALGVAAFISIAGWRLGQRTIDTLLDKAPEGLSSKLHRIVGAVPGVVSVEQVRLRPGGTHPFGDVTVAVSRTLPLDWVRQIKENILGEVKGAGLDIALTLNTIPVALDDETVLEKVLITAAHHRLLVHHVTVQNLDGRLSVCFDLEADANMSLADAHAKATRLEEAIRCELGPLTEVETHIEPLAIEAVSGGDVSSATLDAVATALANAAKGIADIENVHNVRVRQTAAGPIVNFHCLVRGTLPVSAVHKAVDGLERKLRAARPEAVRITGHAEPLERNQGN
jgi:cation diffusion facilitator family transporter